MVSLEAEELGTREAAMAIFEGPNKNRILISALAVAVVIAVIIYLYG